LRHGSNHDLLWIEGQGSVLHPGSTAWLPLMRGSMPTDLLLVHRPGQQELDGFERFPIPPLPEVIALYEHVAAASSGMTTPKVRAVAINGSRLDDKARRQAVAEIEDETGLPCADAVVDGAARLLDAFLDPTATRLER
jgi:uncharacterized NAD-dependent epimerase/dehydratase family protein